jgi:preprotein translocase subunit SecD
MRKNLGGKTALILVLLLIFVYGIFGTPAGVNLKSLGASMINPSAGRNGIHLGLDLRGGTHLILQVMVEEAVGAATDSDAGRLNADLKTAGVTGATVSKPDPNNPALIRISGVPADKAGAVRDLLNSRFGNAGYDVSSGADNTFSVTMQASQAKSIRDRAVQQAIETIRDRVDRLGVSEPVIQEYGLGANQILVELPGIDDPARVKDIIQSTARLEIHQVLGGPYPDQASALQALGGTVPPDAMLISGSGTPPAAGEAPATEIYELKRIPEVAGNDFRDAQPSQDENGRPEVNFSLTNAAGDRFYQFTSTNVGNRLGVVLDGQVREVANIQQAIRDQGRITGLDKQKATDLGMMLRTGALPASIHFLEERTVGPSLGADSIRQGVYAAVFGMLAVMAFMLIYYRGAGINADLALFLNLVILLGFMGFTGSTLTLPGIAGVILTIGMGVDSNVLIFERIREELHAGKAAAAAVDQGFAHAWLTIIDTHVTTMVSAAILFLFGTGPVRGFAVTLIFGLFANLFTAVFVSRVIFDAILRRKPSGAALSI